MTNPYAKVDVKWLSTTVLALAAVGTMMWMIRAEVGRLSLAIDDGNQRMARVETAVHLLADTQDERTRRSVDMALTVSQNSADSAAELLGGVKESTNAGDSVKAVQAAADARTMILMAKQLKTPAPPGYFAAATAMLDDLSSVTDVDVTRQLFSLRVALAEYHSALEQFPEVPSKIVELSVHPGQPIDSARLLSGAVYRPNAQVLLPVQASLKARGAVIDGSELLGGVELLSPVTTFAQGNNSISGLTFKGVTQTLDGAEWNDVVFVNAKIRYRGGPLRLNHVRFVNCTFEVTGNDHGSQFARGLVMGNDPLTIG